MSNHLERPSDEKSLKKFREILLDLENSAAVKAAHMFDGDGEESYKIGKGVTFTKETMDEILEHPDVKLYRAIRSILNLNKKDQ